LPGLFFRKPSSFKGRPAISEFDQEDGHKNQTAEDDVNLEQPDGVAAEPKSRVDSDCAEQYNVRPPSYDKKISLVLQGGGALGSYQAGVYEALESSGYLPDWVAGISIGAINAAIIVGNAPANRVKRLRSFWEEVTAHTNLLPFALFSPLADWQQKSGALTALMFGQPG
jgi:predicted acylesterase/phospholipase RssA